MNAAEFPRKTGDEMKERAAEFARRVHAERPGLSGSPFFPEGLWEEMAEAELLGIGISKEFGGSGGGSETLIEAGRALVNHGRCLGLGLTFMIHGAVARHVMARLGSGEQKARFLPLLADGRLTASIAMSEPGVGAHPKTLSTRAERDGNGWRLSGKKAYLTNGPLAGLFVVVAVTGEREGRKEFSAFLVPRESPGLAVEAPKSLEMLRPSPHCGIVLDSVSVPASALIGTPGAAYEEIMKPFRVVEDVLMAGPVLGGLDALISSISRSLAGKEPEPAIADGIGRFLVMRHALSAVAGEAARLLDSGGMGERLTALTIAFRTLARQTAEALNGMSPGLAGEEEILARDLAAAGGIAAKVTALKQAALGRAFLARAVRP